MTVELRVLGSLRLSASDERDLGSLVRQPKRTALLAYLAAAVPRGFQRRDSLLALFWPELDDAHARAALNQALYVLRNALGEQAIVTRGDGEVGLNDEVVVSDVARFETALDERRPAEALALYHGDLLEGVFVSDAPAFERWLDTERGRLRQRASEGAWALAEEGATEGDAVEAGRWARRATALLPAADEAGVRRLMSFLCRLGDRAAALRAYDGFAARLKDEYELEPSAETQALALTLREEGRRPAKVRLVRLKRASVPSILVAVQRQVPVAWLAASLVVVAALAVALWVGMRRVEPAPRPVVRFGLQLPGVDLVVSGVAGSPIALSPDGSRLVFLADSGGATQLFLRALDRLEAAAVPHTRGAYLPFFSPDGAWLGFVSEGRIRKVSLDGGPAITLCPVAASVMGASWSPKGEIVFATEAGLWRVSADGGEPRVVAQPDTGRGIRYRWPQVLPGGRTAIFTHVDDTGFQLAVVSLETGTVRLLGLEGTGPHFVAARFLVFARSDGALLAAPFDPDAPALDGPVLPLTEGITVGFHGAAKIGVAAAAGALALVPERFAGRVLLMVDRAGREQPLPVPPQGYHTARFSADGRRIVMEILLPEGPGRELAVFDLETRTLRRLPSDGSSAYPSWSPDGRRIAFATSSGGRLPGFEIRWVSPDGDTTGTLLGAEHSQIPHAFAPDGRALVIGRDHPKTRRDLWILGLEDRSQRPYLETSSDEGAAALSPNGRWLAYTSDQSGRDEVYISSFPVPGAALRVSQAGGREPRWGSDGLELFYRSKAGMMVARVRVTLASRVERHDVLFDDRPYVAIPNGAGYDVHPDGQRLLMVRRGPESREIVVVLNWFDQLRARGR